MDTINFAWWNLQNFFDTDDDPISQDFEFTGDWGWTEAVFRTKLESLAAALGELHAKRPIGLFACCEIEKDTLLTSLLEEANLPLTVVKDSSGTSDLRGIDTAIAYDKRLLTLVSKQSHVVSLRYATRDIFEAVFRVKSSGETLVVIASHWPSRSLGKYRSDPLRIAVAEQIAYLVQRHVKLQPLEYEAAREAGDIDLVRERWDTPILILGDFNDHPGDRSLVDHLRASSEVDRVSGRTNNIDGFQDTSKYRGVDHFLYNPMWRFYGEADTGTYFIDGLRSGEKFPNRYQLLDQAVVSRGLLKKFGLRLDIDSIQIERGETFATSGGRPRRFKFSKPKSAGGPVADKPPSGLSDHLPVTGTLKTDFPDT